MHKRAENINRAYRWREWAILRYPNNRHWNLLRASFIFDEARSVNSDAHFSASTVPEPTDIASKDNAYIHCLFYVKIRYFMRSLPRFLIKSNALKAICSHRCFTLNQWSSDLTQPHPIIFSFMYFSGLWYRINGKRLIYFRKRGYKNNQTFYIYFFFQFFSILLYRGTAKSCGKKSLSCSCCSDLFFSRKIKERRNYKVFAFLLQLHGTQNKVEIVTFYRLFSLYMWDLK